MKKNLLYSAIIAISFALILTSCKEDKTVSPISGKWRAEEWIVDSDNSSTIDSSDYRYYWRNSGYDMLTFKDDNTGFNEIHLTNPDRLDTVIPFRWVLTGSSLALTYPNSTLSITPVDFGRPGRMTITYTASDFGFRGTDYKWRTFIRE